MRCTRLYHCTLVPSLFLLPIVVMLSLMVTPGFSADEESLGRSAEQAGKLREALKHYVTALQATPEGSPTEQQLRETIITLARKLDPPPAVPEEALRHLGRGQAAVEVAQGQQDYQRAIAEFEKATRLAPWLPNAYYNLGVVQEKAGKLGDAIRSFHLYVLAAPSAADAQEVRTRIFGLEFKAERQREQEGEQQAKLQEEASQARADERLAAKMVGTWHNPITRESLNLGRRVVPMASSGWRIRIRAEGTKVFATCLGYPFHNSEDLENRYYGDCDRPFFEGVVKGGRLTGRWHYFSYGSRGTGMGRTEPFESDISAREDGQSFTLKKIGDRDNDRNVWLRE